VRGAPLGAEGVGSHVRMKDSKKKQSKSQKKGARTAPRKDKPDKKQARKKSSNSPNTLGHLQDQIDQTTSEDEKGRALLRDLTTDSKDYLEGFAKGEKRPKESFLQRLRDAIDHPEHRRDLITVYPPPTDEAISCNEMMKIS
jgi:hypothetical protein